MTDTPHDSPPGDLELWPRIKQAIESSGISRANAEYCLPRCQKKNCGQYDPGQLDWLYRMFIDSVIDSVYTELLCKAVSEPDLGDDTEHVRETA